MRAITDDMPDQIRKGREPLPAALVEMIRSMRESGMSIMSIAAATGVSKSVVHRHVTDIGRDSRLVPAPKPYWLPKVKELIAGGITANQAAKALRLSS